MKTRSAVPRRWPGSTILCLGAGPSLCAEDLILAEASGYPCIAVNNAAQVALWAPVIYASDVEWWRDHPAMGVRPRLNYTLREGDPAPQGVTELERTGQAGVDWDPTGLRSGGHSGYAAVNLAVHLGAARILLLGYDMQSRDGQHHADGLDHPNGSHPRYQQWLPLYAGLLRDLTCAKITLVNCSRETAIPFVPRGTLADYVQREATA